MNYGIVDYGLIWASILGAFVIHELGHYISFVLLYQKLPLVRISLKQFSFSIGQQSDYRKHAGWIYAAGVLPGFVWILWIMQHSIWTMIMLPLYFYYSRGDILYLRTLVRHSMVHKRQHKKPKPELDKKETYPVGKPEQS